MEIKDIISNAKVYGLDDSVTASKYPMAVDINDCNSEITPRTHSLASSNMGEGHDNFLNGIIVQFDLTFTIKAWTEAERYHFFDFVSSQSTMHRISKFDLDKSYIEYVDPTIIEIMKHKVNEYNMLLHKLKRIREGAIEEYSAEELLEILKRKYLELLYSNPCGFKLTARMTTNYRQLKTMYYQRKPHRLPEWKVFCEWIESLPCFRELILNKKRGELNE
jgi:hypothetical protein